MLFQSKIINVVYYKYRKPPDSSRTIFAGAEKQGEADTDFPLILCIFLPKAVQGGRFGEKDTVQYR